jgi:hypothetical protein
MRDLERHEQNFRRKMRRNSAFVGGIILCGIGAMIPLWDYQTKFDRVLFCFKPPVVHRPNVHQFCQGKKIRIGIAWRVEQERLSNLEFDQKVRVLKPVPAQNSQAVWYGLGGAGCLLTAYAIFKKLTDELEQSFPVLFGNLRARALEIDLENEKHLGIVQHSKELETDFTKEQLSRQNQALKIQLMTDAEREDALKKAGHYEEIEEAVHGLKLSDIGKQTAENALSKAKAEHEMTQLQQAIAPDTDAPALIGVTLPDYPRLEKIEWWQWDWFQTKPHDLIPHIRIIGSTGMGKTTLAGWVLKILPGEAKVITIKRKKDQWQGLEVLGVPEDFDTIEQELLSLEADRKAKIAQLADGIDPPLINIGIDEWRAIKEHVDCATNIIRDEITLSREAGHRYVLMAQGRQVKTWGLKDESDLTECFATLFMGKFAIEEAQSYYNHHQMIPDSSKANVIEALEKAGNRAAWISASFGEFPALIPHIS